MNILSGVTGKQVGTMDRLGRVTTSDRGLKGIMAAVNKDRSVVIPSRSDVVGEDKIIDFVEIVSDTDPDFVNALIIYLLREGYEVVV